jgi:hypothetical protein
MSEANIDPDVPMSGGDPSQLADPPPDVVPQRQMEDALRSISTGWLRKLELARKAKKAFSDDAKEAMNFFDGGENFFWKEGAAPYSKISPPSFRMTVNRAFEAVKLIGSVIYARNPVRTVTAKKFPAVPPEAVGIDTNQQPQTDPMTGQPILPPEIEQYIQASQQIGMVEQQREAFSEIISAYLNYTPGQLNLKEHTRKVVDEGILKGMGVWWTELIEMGGEDGPPVGLIGSFHDNVDNLLLDPDADEQEDILWCARRCVHPIAEVAEKYGLERSELKGHMESFVARSMEEDRGYKMKKKNGKTNDLIVYWKIWSKTGFGHNLKGSPKEYAQMFDGLGPNCYLVVAEGVDYPLNVPKGIALEEPDETGLPNSLFTRTRWPIPFYADHNGWPFTPFQCHRKPGSVWPISHMKPGMPELKFLNWALSFLATRVMISSKTMVGVSKAAGDDIKEQLLRHEQSGFSLIELSETLGRSVNDIVSVLQLPQVTPELWTIVQAVSEMFDKRVGLTELTYGMTRNSYRSAAEAQVKSEQISVRPDDMANVLEDAMSMLARREALAARWLLQEEDIAPVLGPIGASVWKSLQEQVSLGQLAMNYDYRIEAGSARKPNKAGRIESLQIALQTMGPTLQNLLAQGVVGPWNALMRDYLEAIDVDPSGYMVPEPPPPQPPAQQLPPPQEGGNAEPGAGGPPDQPQQVPPELQP